MPIRGSWPRAIAEFDVLRHGAASHPELYPDAVNDFGVRWDPPFCRYIKGSVTVYCLPMETWFRKWTKLHPLFRRTNFPELDLGQSGFLFMGDGSGVYMCLDENVGTGHQGSPCAKKSVPKWMAEHGYVLAESSPIGSREVE